MAREKNRDSWKGKEEKVILWKESQKEVNVEHRVVIGEFAEQLLIVNVSRYNEESVAEDESKISGAEKQEYTNKDDNDS